MWVGGACKRNTNVTANECSWHFDNNDITSARAERMFFNRFVGAFCCLGSSVGSNTIRFNVFTMVKEPANILKWDRQLLVAILIWVLGCAVIALQWLSGHPGTGMMICWIFPAMNVSYLIYTFIAFL